jgi:hypothetical protein
MNEETVIARSASDGAIQFFIVTLDCFEPVIGGAYARPVGSQ